MTGTLVNSENMKMFLPALSKETIEEKSDSRILETGII